MSTVAQQHISHGFSLLFDPGELVSATGDNGGSNSGGFLRIEGTLYKQDGQGHLNAAGRYAFVPVATDDGTKANWCDYASLADLMSALKLPQEKVQHLDARLMALLNRPM